MPKRNYRGEYDNYHKQTDQKKRRAAKKRGKNICGMDYDHTTRSFVSASRNRSGFGKGTKLSLIHI